MKGTLGFLTAAVVLAFGAFGCSDSTPTDAQSAPAAKGAAAGLPATTAQSAMLSITGEASFTLADTSVYQFDDDAGAAYFTGGTLVQRRNLARSQRCTFWDGGTLSGAVVGGGPNAVTISPTSSSPVAAGTAWNLISSTTGSVEIVFDGLIIGESWMANNQFPIGDDGVGSGGKYSFTLRHDDGSSRVENLAYSLDGGTTWTPITATQGHVDDIEYVKTAGETALYDGWVASILAGDTHSGNDSDGADIETFSLDLSTIGSGSHELLVRATVKGVEALSTFNFDVTNNSVVIAANCAH